jgi:hypothetical protein
MGQLRFFDIEDFISATSSFDPDFGDRLKAGFNEQYQSLRDRGMNGDDLYIALAEWASGGVDAPMPRAAAGVAVLSYLFHVCDVFEREPVTGDAS